MNNKSQYNIKRAIYAMICAVIIIIPFFYIITEPEKESNTVSLDSGWDVIINHKKYHDITLSSFTFNNTNRGDVVELDRIMDTKCSQKNPVVKLYSIHSTVDVYVGNARIYT